MPFPAQTPSAQIMAEIRRYIAEHLRDAADSIENVPRRAHSPFEKVRERYGAVRKRGVRAESPIRGAGIVCPRFGTHLDGILSRLRSRLDKADETFSERLLRLIGERGMTDVEVYKRAGIDRKHFSKMRNDKNYQPKIKVVYALIFALRLNLDEAKDLLVSAGYGISPAREYDLVMEFCIMEGYDIDTVNGILYEMGMDVLM